MKNALLKRRKDLQLINKKLIVKTSKKQQKSLRAKLNRLQETQSQLNKRKP